MASALLAVTRKFSIAGRIYFYEVVHGQFPKNAYVPIVRVGGICAVNDRRCARDPFSILIFRKRARTHARAHTHTHTRREIPR